MSPQFDRWIRNEVERAAEGMRTRCSIDDLRSRVARRRMWRRIQAGVLTLVVVGATAGGAYGMTQVFRAGTGHAPASNSKPIEHGERIAFVSDRSGNGEIYTMAPDGSDVARLTRNAAEDLTPSWSPDGARLAFWRYSETTDGDIYVMDANGQHQHALTTGPARDAYPAWSPEGTKIAFSRDFQISTMNTDGSGITQLTSMDQGADFPAWSPDATRIVFVGDLGARHSLYVMNADGTGLTRIYREITLDTGEQVTPGSWSPDGKWILFTRIDTSVGRCSHDDLFKIRPDGTGLTRLTHTDNSAADSWSPDGSKILFERAFGDACTVQLFTMNADGTGRTRITSGPANNSGGNWGRGD